MVFSFLKSFSTPFDIIYFCVSFPPPELGFCIVLIEYQSNYSFAKKIVPFFSITLKKWMNKQFDIVYLILKEFVQLFYGTERSPSQCR